MVGRSVQKQTDQRLLGEYKNLRYMLNKADWENPPHAENVVQKKKGWFLLYECPGRSWIGPRRIRVG